MKSRSDRLKSVGARCHKFGRKSVDVASLGSLGWWVAEDLYAERYRGLAEKYKLLMP